MTARQKEKLDEWMATSEAAIVLGVSVRRVHQMTDEGKLRRFVLTSRFSLVHREDVATLAADPDRSKTGPKSISAN